MTATKQVIEIQAEFVDAANDSVKWLVILAVAFAWNTFAGRDYGYTRLGATLDPYDMLRTAAITAAALFAYHFIIQRFVVFAPKAGQSTYYWALKRN